MGDFEKVALAFLGGTFTLAIISVLLSKNSNTTSVISSSGTALSNVINAAESPVSGQSGGSFGSTSLPNVSSLFNSSGLNLGSVLNSIGGL